MYLLCFLCFELAILQNGPSHTHLWLRVLSIEKCERNVDFRSVQCAKCQKICFLLWFGFEKCGANAVKIASETGINVALDLNSIYLTCPSCDAIFMTDAMNAKMKQTENGTNNKPNEINFNQTPHKSMNTLKPSTSSTKQTTLADSPMSFGQLKQEITNMAKISETVRKSVMTSSADICELKTITTDTNNIVKSHNSQSSDFNNDFSTKLNELSTQTQSFSDIVKQQQQNEKRQPSMLLKCRIATNSTTNDRTPNRLLPSCSSSLFHLKITVYSHKDASQTTSVHRTINLIKHQRNQMSKTHNRMNLCHEKIYHRCQCITKLSEASQISVTSPWKWSCQYSKYFASPKHFWIMYTITVYIFRTISSFIVLTD